MSRKTEARLIVKASWIARGDDPELNSKILDRIIGEIDNMPVNIGPSGIESEVRHVDGTFEIEDFETEVQQPMLMGEAELPNDVEKLGREVNVLQNHISDAYQAKCIAIIKALLASEDAKELTDSNGYLYDPGKKPVPQNILLECGLWAHATAYGPDGFLTKPDERDDFYDPIKEPWDYAAAEPYDTQPPHVLIRIAERIVALLGYED
jgi:hypothetical protein